MIVVDTNIIAYLLLDSHQKNLAEQVMAQDNRWLVPTLWKSEFRNVLTLYMRHGKMSLNEALFAMSQAEQLLKHSEQAVSSANVLNLVSSSSCSAYDCEFVSLAQKFGVPLVTADKQILREFPQTAVSPQTFISRS